MKKDRRALKRNIYYLIIVLGWGVLALVASQFIIAILMHMLLGEKFTQPFWMMIYYLLNYLLVLALILFVLPRLVNLYQQRFTRLKNDEQDSEIKTESENEFSPHLDELGLARWPSFVDIGLAPIAYILYILIANLITNFMSNFAWFDGEQPQDVGFGGFIAGSNRVWAIIAIVFIAPIAEEIIMRGWLYGKVRRKLPAYAAILLVSVLFGVMHGQWNAGVATFVLSLILCSLREITGSVWSGILLHILSNGIAFYILYIANTGIM